MGGTIGYFIFGWLFQQGLYALLIPPTLLGYGAGFLARQRSVPLGGVCAVLGLGLGLFTEWKFSPFIANDKLSYFLAHVHELRPMTLIMLLIGTVLAYRAAVGGERPARPESY